jgi:hypothetical protein
MPYTDKYAFIHACKWFYRVCSYIDIQSTYRYFVIIWDPMHILWQYTEGVWVHTHYQMEYEYVHIKGVWVHTHYQKVCLYNYEYILVWSNAYYNKIMSTYSSINVYVYILIKVWVHKQSSVVWAHTSERIKMGIICIATKYE